MRYVKQIFLPFLVLILVLVSAAPTVMAADGSFNLSTSPLPINLTGKPGDTLETDIRVKNGNPTTEKLYVSLKKFAAYGEEGKPEIKDREAGDDYFDWVSFSPQSFEAPPNEWVSFKMTVKLPQSAAFGYYYAVVISRANQQLSTNKKNTLVGSTAVLVLVEAQVPNAKRELNIVNFTVNKHVFEFLPAIFNVKLHNSGNVHVVPTGNIFIKKGSQIVANLPVNVVRGNVLPDSNRNFSAIWNDGFPVYIDKIANGKTVLDDHDKPVQTLTWDYSKLSKLKFGHYTANLLMAYDNGKGDTPLEATVSFWIIPWRILIFIIGIPLVVIALLIFLFISRQRARKQLRKLKTQ